VLKFSWVIGCVNAELKTNILVISTSIIRVNAMNDHMLLIHIPVCQKNASSYWCTMQQEGGVKLFCSMLFPMSSWDFPICVCWNALTIWCQDSMLCCVRTLLPCLYYLDTVLFLLLLLQVGPCSLMSGWYFSLLELDLVALLYAVFCHCRLVWLIHRCQSCPLHLVLMD
jgi:hypothetical protein